MSLATTRWLRHSLLRCTSFASSRFASTPAHSGGGGAEVVGNTRVDGRGKRTPHANSAARCEVLESVLANALPQDSGPVVIRLSSTDVYANLALEEWCVANLRRARFFCVLKLFISV